MVDNRYINERSDVEKSVEFTHKCLKDIIDGNYPKEKFIITIFTWKL